MNLLYNLIDWQASAPGLSTPADWHNWAQREAAINADQPLAKCSQLPMMTARRLSSGSRAAVDCGLALLRRQQIDAIVFTSRHGELERNLRILNALAAEQSLSPTDFAMSVHNSAVGSLTIAASAPIVSTSLAAGVDTFQQGLVEVTALHAAGYQQVLLVDFDGPVPERYHRWLSGETLHIPYAVALVLGRGEQLRCTSQPAAVATASRWPQSLQFLHGWQAQQRRFMIGGGRINWQWEHNDV
ncbi:beta-ketoacyl synthase chain length factor [Erwiniaceae bacterium BAC15a-03b]|uniref:Beta-ketoacyl synthase chain length factor n=1 Tax=Winslowiella arboricola TaxID=2978220 RepID=A0A9J6Q1X1_9GAMM|nr:beta-ketoacyl synthase chain length factor [Winslowiella arboricola]MCU5775348.1 beta-ketoacyl synthase chain length factor [Winslowiella arboricola]MCU5780255.1 beta-ketoacyl synthase chain length factor [Winslowiella arboricola]